MLEFFAALDMVVALLGQKTEPMTRDTEFHKATGPIPLVSVPLCNIPRGAHEIVFVEPVVPKHPCVVVAIVLRNGM